MGKGTAVPVPTNAPKAGEVYKHYKGDLYKIVGMAIDSSTDDDRWDVIYEPMYENAAASMFARPLAQWLETVEWEGKRVERFSKV